MQNSILQQGKIVSCCTKKGDCSSQKEIHSLKKHFDIVEVKDLKRYRLLTLKDKSNHSTVDWVVWLEVKVAYGYKTKYSSKDDDVQLSEICSSILKWVSLLKKEEAPKIAQLSFFDSPLDDSKLEEEPIFSASMDSKVYMKNLLAVKMRNISKTYSFFDFFDPILHRSAYHDIDYRNFLPNSNEEFIEIVKKAIVAKETTGEDIDSSASWDNEYNYIARNAILSDYEIAHRIKFMIRLFFAPMLKGSLHSCDEFNDVTTPGEHQYYRYWFVNGRTESSSHVDMDKEITSFYDLFDPEFIQWIRDYFNVKKIEPISDEEALKANLLCYFRSCFGHEYTPDVDLLECKNWKQFRTIVHSRSSYDRNGGGTGSLKDGFSGQYCCFGKGKVSVEQPVVDRVRMGRSLKGFEQSDLNDSRVLLYSFAGDEIYQQTFDLFKSDRVLQTSIFDFLVA